MAKMWIVVLLTILCAANVILLFALTYSSKGSVSKETKLGFNFMKVVLVLNMLFSIGGVVLW